MNVKLSSICEDMTMKEFLKEELLFSNSAIKKYMSNKELKKIVKCKEEISLPIDLLNEGLIGPAYKGKDIHEFYNDDIFVVVNKPEGIHGHSIEYSDDSTVLNYLRETDHKLNLGKRDNNKERGLLYRLDQKTSGVLIYIKDQEVSQTYRDKFKDLVLSKKYIALVEGNVEIDEELTHHLTGSGTKGSLVIESSDGRECKAYYKSLKYYKEIDATLLLVKLKTGFRHQIRVQCATHGSPIVGDTHYGGEDSDRMYLHALEYRILFESGEYSFVADKNERFQKKLRVDSLKCFLNQD